jgi:hypothetical protein
MWFFSLVHSVLFWLCCAVSLIFAVANISDVYAAPYGALAVLAAAILGYFRPAVACAAALLLVPLGGNRPGTSQAFFSVLVGGSLFLGLAARGLFSQGKSASKISSEELRNPLIFLGLLYTFFSLASLIAVPISHAIDDLRNSVSRESLRAVIFSIQAIERTSEHALVYSYLSVYYTALSYLLGVAIFRLCKTDLTRRPRLFIGAVFSGLMISLVVGVLDYYGGIDLSFLRGLDPIVNPDGKQFRLQSLFGHSGWFAEYLTLAIPTCLIILSLTIPFWARALIILCALAFGEFALVLTYQRGGWLSYPLTLFAVWAAIYVVRLLEKQETDIGSALRRSFTKVLVSLPVTVAASLALVVLIQGRGTVEGAISPYVSRFKDIQRTGDRTEFFQAGVLIGSLHPILGGGSDSFAWQFEREFEAPQGAFSGKIVLPLHGSAHNVYAQTFSGKGLCGLLALVCIPLWMLMATPGVLRDQRRTISAKLVVLTGACCGCAFLIYGNVQEVFYIQVLQFLFFAIVGVVAAVAYERQELGTKRLLVSPWMCGVLVGAHVVWEFVAPGATKAFYQEKRLFGCYSQEVPTSGAPYRWCGERGRVELPVEPGSAAVVVAIEAGPQAQIVKLFDVEGRAVSVTLSPGERKDVAVPVSDESRASGRAIIGFVASSSFVPQLLWPASADMRRLAFKLVGDS